MKTCPKVSLQWQVAVISPTYYIVTHLHIHLLLLFLISLNIRKIVKPEFVAMISTC